MNWPKTQFAIACVAAACLLQTICSADEIVLDGSRPACGKVCKLVCETKKLSSICYGSEGNDICIPNPSREGCKHCAVCYGKDAADPCGDCRSCQPKCQFCWRDWFACGCAQPRSVRMLTTYQAEKNICWYHWEVVDAACCDCVTKNGAAGAADKNSPQQAHRTIYKPAPDSAQLGDVLPISDEEWVKLAAVLAPDPTEVAVSAPPKLADTPNDGVKRLDESQKSPSFADRLQRMWKK